MLSEIYEMFPECGDLEKPKFAFFFDEAHLLFDDAPKALIEQVERIVRLIRSKGVSVWFISQHPSDVPDSVLGQIGNRVQHGLRAYTPADQKALRAAANSFRTNPNFDTEETLTLLGTGEALVSVLDAKGIPTIVEKANILPPRSSMDAASDADVEFAIKQSPLFGKYEETEDKESAFEKINEQREEEAKEAEKAAKEEAKAKEKEKKEKEKAKSKKKTSSAAKKTTSAFNKTVNSAANTIGREIGKKVVRGIFDTFFKG